MPKIPSKKEQGWGQAKTPLEQERARLKRVYGDEEPGPRKPLVTWLRVVFVFVFFSFLGVLGLEYKIPLLYWGAIGLGNTILFFMVLYLVIRAATKRD